MGQQTLIHMLSLSNSILSFRKSPKIAYQLYSKSYIIEEENRNSFEMSRVLKKTFTVGEKVGYPLAP